jgi:acetyl-CoA carboxylase beta subunit
MSVKTEILKEREKAERIIIEMNTLLDQIKSGELKDEPAIKKCPQCGTVNYHYYAKSNSWCCAFC